MVFPDSLKTQLSLPVIIELDEMEQARVGKVITGMELKFWLRQAAERIGFDLCGIAPVTLSERNQEQYLWWLDQGFQGEMGYMERAERGDIRALLPGVRSVICAAMVYNGPQPKSIQCDDPARGWIARYAWGDDYHDLMRERLERLLAELRTAAPCAFEAKVYVDTGPLLERAVAHAAGLGWFGKNTCLIHQKIGSWFLLGEILTTLDLEPDEPAPDRCGTCTRCIDACPTQAILAPRVLDSTRCISYFTIESRSAIPEQFRAAIGRHVFGCDICQDVCPWNAKAPVTAVPELQPRAAKQPGGAEPRANGDVPDSVFNPPLEWLASLTEEQFRAVFRKSPVKRAKFRGMLRNVAVAMGNSGDSRFLPSLERLAGFQDTMVQEHAQWALKRLQNREGRANALPQRTQK